MTPTLPAARRVLALLRDLRRRGEEQAEDTPDGREAAYAITARNPDVVVYDRHMAQFAPMRKAEDVLADVVAGIIAEEMRKEMP